jgi:hypothetical protein
VWDTQEWDDTQAAESDGEMEEDPQPWPDFSAPDEGATMDTVISEDGVTITETAPTEWP